MIPIINFDILETYDLRILRIADTSEWKHLISEPSYIDITVPARKKAVTLYFDKNSVNIFNSNNLEITNSSLDKLPDGIYKLKVYVCEGCEFYHEAYYLRTVRAKLRLNQIIIGLGLCNCHPDEVLLNKIVEIDFLFKSAHANVIDGNTKQGMCEYEKAISLLDDLEHCSKTKCK